MYLLIVAATSKLKVLKIRDKQSGSAIGVKQIFGFGHIISGRDNKNHNVVVQYTDTVHQKG